MAAIEKMAAAFKVDTSVMFVDILTKSGAASYVKF